MRRRLRPEILAASSIVTARGEMVSFVDVSSIHVSACHCVHAKDIEQVKESVADGSGQLCALCAQHRQLLYRLSLNWLPPPLLRPRKGLLPNCGFQRALAFCRQIAP